MSIRDSHGSHEGLRARYGRMHARRTLLLIAGALLLLALMVLAAMIGPADLDLWEVLAAIAARFVPGLEAPAFDDAVVWDLRLPRIVMGALCGMGLAISGAQMQGITRNPLVSPFTIGISSAAAFGASVAIMFGIGFVGTGTLLIMTNAFVFAMVCALIVFGLARLRDSRPETMVLAGIALTYLFGAMTSFIHYFASEEDLMAMVHWSFGTLTGSTWGEIGIVALMLALTAPILLRFSWDLNAIASGGDESARALGVNTRFVRSASLVLSTFLAAGIISFTGIIGFVGLVAPHIARFLIGGDHRFLLPGSALVGGILMVGADTLGRTILSPVMVPIGIVVSFLGVPLFLYLLMTRSERHWGS